MSEIQLGNNYVLEETGQDELVIKDTTKGALFRYDRAADEITAIKPYIDITTEDITTTAQLIAPRYDETSQAPSLEGMLIVVPSSGTDTAGAYVHDGTGYALLDESGGASAGSLSGLTIDTTKDFGGFSLTGLGHDEVDVPQTRELTVADFESGVLPEAFVSSRSDFTVQSSVVSSGSYALEAQTDAAGIDAPSGLATYPQRGDTFSLKTYFTDTDDEVRIRFGAQNKGEFGSAYILRIRASSDSITLIERPSNTAVITKNVDISSHLNEWLEVTVKWGTDDSFSLTLVDSNGSELASGSGSVSNDFYTSGFVSFYPRNVSASSLTQYFDDWTVTRRLPEYYSNTQKGTTELGNDVQPSGAIHTGPQEAPLNASRQIYAQAPVNDSVTQGTTSYLTLLQSGLNPTPYVERVFDGRGGAYAHRIQGGIGRLTRLNALLSWEYDTFADVPNFTSSDNANASWSYTVSGRPRTMRAESDGSNTTNNDHGGIMGTPLVTYESLGGFALTFTDVVMNDGSVNNAYRIGLTDVADMSTDVLSNGNALVYQNVIDDTKLVEVSGGTTNTLENLTDVDHTVARDVRLAYDGSEVFLTVDGGAVQSSIQSTTVNADFRPFIQVFTNSNNSTAEWIELDQMILEPIAEVLQ